MRQAGEVTFADAHKERKNEGYVASYFCHVSSVLHKYVVAFSEGLLHVLLQGNRVFVIPWDETCHRPVGRHGAVWSKDPPGWRPTSEWSAQVGIIEEHLNIISVSCIHFWNPIISTSLNWMSVWKWKNCRYFSWQSFKIAKSSSQPESEPTTKWKSQWESISFCISQCQQVADGWRQWE